MSDEKLLKQLLENNNFIKQKTWIEYARTIPDEDVIESYVNEIEDITNCYDQSSKIKEQIKQIIEIYKG